MNFRNFKIFRISNYKLNIYVSIALWVLGLLTGILLLNTCGQGANILFASANTKASLIMSLVTGLPAVICSVIFAYSLAPLCYPLIFGVGFNRGLCGMLVFSAFGSSAWLIRVFLLFSAAVSCTFMWWLLFRNVINNRQANKRLILRTVLFSLAISFIDVFIISPFLINLL